MADTSFGVALKARVLSSGLEREAHTDTHKLCLFMTLKISDLFSL